MTFSSQEIGLITLFVLWVVLLPVVDGVLAGWTKKE
jgi:hypothetical protein